MKYCKKANSITGIIIAVVILSFVMFGIMSVLNYSKDNSQNYLNETDFFILQKNTENIIKNLDTSEVNSNEIFYLYKDKNNDEYKIMTGSSNENYKYIDRFGNNIDINTYDGEIYIRELKKSADNLKTHLNPSEIKDLSYHFDASNIDGQNNTTLTIGNSVNYWLNLANNESFSFNGTRPILNNNINSNPALRFFNTTNLRMTTNLNDNLGDKSFVFVFKTGDSLSSNQYIYGESLSANSSSVNGVAFGLYKKQLLGQSPNVNNYSWYELPDIVPNTLYTFTIIFSSSNTEETSQNIVKIYLDGNLLESYDNIETLYPIEIAAIGYINNSFTGDIGEVIIANYALNETETRGLQQYLNSKWLYSSGSESKLYNIEVNISKHNFN